MKLKHTVLISVLGLFSIFATCNPKLYSPPTRLLSLETPALLEPREQSLTLAGGNHDHFDIFHDFEAYSGTAVYRRGLTNNLEGSAGVSFLSVSPAGYSLDFNPITGSVRAAVKYNPSYLERFWALRGGVGLGFSPIGEYATGDVGLILGFENPWVTPFVSGGCFRSQPFDTRRVEFDTNSHYTDELDRTWGWEFGGGIRIGPFPVDKGQSLAIYILGARTDCYSPNKVRFESFSLGGGLEFFFNGR
jgi:hypothetical protein